MRIRRGAISSRSPPNPCRSDSLLVRLGRRRKPSGRIARMVVALCAPTVAATQSCGTPSLEARHQAEWGSHSLIRWTPLTERKQVRCSANLCPHGCDKIRPLCPPSGSGLCQPSAGQRPGKCKQTRLSGLASGGIIAPGEIGHEEAHFDNESLSVGEPWHSFGWRVAG